MRKFTYGDGVRYDQVGDMVGEMKIPLSEENYVKHINEREYVERTFDFIGQYIIVNREKILCRDDDTALKHSPDTVLTMKRARRNLKAVYNRLDPVQQEHFNEACSIADRLLSEFQAHIQSMLPKE